MATAPQPIPDIKSIRVRGPVMQRRTFDDGKTKILLRPDTEADTQVVISVFLPDGAHGYSFDYPQASQVHVTAKRLIRVVRITITGPNLRGLMNLIENDMCLSPEKWTVDSVKKMFSHHLAYLHFQY